MGYNNGPYFVATFNRPVTKTAAAKIDAAIKQIDPAADFIRLYQAGNDTHGWIERPSDGTNNYDYVRERNQRMVAVAEEILRGRKA